MNDKEKELKNDMREHDWYEETMKEAYEENMDKSFNSYI